MKVFTLRRTLWVPQPIDNVFPFFSDIHNLDRITPKWLRFRSVDHPADVAEGTRLQHKFKIRGFPVTWVSEITHWDPPYGFVDEQKKGPYRYWRHEHHFREERDGTVCEDVGLPGSRMVVGHRCRTYNIYDRSDMKAADEKKEQTKQTLTNLRRMQDNLERDQRQQEWNRERAVAALVMGSH